MSVFKVSLNDFSRRTGFRMWVYLETSVKTVAELYEQLQEDKVIYGQALYTKSARESDLWEVVERRERVIGREAIYSIEVPEVRFVEYED